MNPISANYQLINRVFEFTLHNCALCSAMLTVYFYAVDHDDEFVVPHMDISCTQNSYAYQRVLEEPWTYIHNWDSLTVNMQQSVMQAFMLELQEIKSGNAYTDGVFVGEAGDGVSPSTDSAPTATSPAEPQEQVGVRCFHRLK